MASAFDISLRTNFKELEKSLDYLARRQIPFAEATALTAIARRVKTAQTEALPSVLRKKPTPFSSNAFAVIPATKTSLTAVVFAKDEQAEYLAPSEVGGMQILGTKKALLKPVNVQLNQYGNIPRGTVARQLGKPNIFSGSITFRSGQTVSGIWQRGTRGARRDQGHGTKGRNLNVIGSARSTLTLLERWSEGVEITPHLGYHERAQLIVQSSYQTEFASALNKALTTAKPT